MRGFCTGATGLEPAIQPFIDANPTRTRIVYTIA